MVSTRGKGVGETIMKYVFPAVFHPESEGGYNIYFPDIARGAAPIE